MILNKKYKLMLLSLMFIFLICLNVASASNETSQSDLTDDVNLTDDVDSVSVVNESANVTDVHNDADENVSDVVVGNDSRKKTVIIVDQAFERVANDYYAGERGGFFYGYLEDEDGNPLANKLVQIAVNGPIYNVTTDDEGRAGLQVNFANANVYTYALVFSGDDEYAAASMPPCKLTVTKKTTWISASAKTFKKSAKSKSISVTLKTSKNPYDNKMYLKAGKKLTLKVNGKTYKAKINSKGVAKFKVKLTKKGKYVAKIKFAGDRTYKECSKSVKITIK